MVLSPGTRLGPYEILSTIGTGGMGEVYQANDTRLNRYVAIKVLPAKLSDDSEHRIRFEREARTISSLSHPNICSLYDIGHQDGIDFLVMEYIEGETLATRLSKGPLPTDQVLRFGMEIANALDDAHRKGIIHRDLKPANIMITRSGSKLLDFGLAKLSIPDQESNILNLSTQQHQLTGKGNILGTIQYMSPEQLEGKEVDGRSDIFSFGSILYEMATGRKAFSGSSPASIITSILSSDPPSISSIRPVMPESLDRIVQSCLAKNPDERWQTPHDVALQLKWMADGSSSSGRSTISPSKPKRQIRWAWILSAFLFLATLVLVTALYKSFQQTTTSNPLPVRRLSIVMPQDSIVYSMAISPDGQRVAYVVTEQNGTSQLWLRQLDSTESQVIPGTDGATFPFWSPDSRSIGFFTGRELKRVDLGGGPPESLCDADAPRGGTWNRQGDILFALNNLGPLYKIQATGGVETPVTKLDSSREEIAHRFPHFLPDGRHFLYVILANNTDNEGVYVGSLDSSLKKRVQTDAQMVEYVYPGFGLFARNRKLMARHFDLNRLEFTGEAIPVADNIEPESGWAAGLFSVSEDALVYGDTKEWHNQPVWFDRSGKEIVAIGQPGHYYIFSDLSLDGKKLLTYIDGKMWNIDTLHGVASRFALTNDAPTIFSLDGTNVAYAEVAQAGDNLFKRPLSGTGKAEILMKSRSAVGSLCWSRDGKFILYGTIDPKTLWDMWVLPLSGERKPYLFLQSEFREADGRFSPDGKWVAYVSDETGRPEVYVRSFPPEAGGKWEISTTGGEQPRWRRDGKELYYLTTDRKLMAMEVKTGDTFQTGSTKVLFETRAAPNIYPNGDSNQYFPAEEGQRFLINTLTEDKAPIQITVMLNWKSLLKK